MVPDCVLVLPEARTCQKKDNGYTVHHVLSYGFRVLFEKTTKTTVLARNKLDETSAPLEEAY